jgi:diguanylate cyclase (GGDEF)-like protein/PAS domain S-box-containing protein
MGPEEHGQSNSILTSRGFLDSLSEGLVFHDCRGKIVDFNQSALTLLGLTRDQLLGRTSYDVVWGVVREDGSVFPGDEHPAMVTLRTSQPCTKVLMGVDRPGLPRVWISVSSRLIAHDGDVVGVSASFVDVTALKTANDQLATLGQHYQLLAENASDVVLETDDQMRIMWVSPSVERLMGWRPRDLIGMFGFDLACGEHRELAIAGRDMILDGGVPSAVELRCRTADGGERWMQVNCRVIHDQDGKVTSLVVGLSDIQAEVMERSARSESEVRYQMLIENQSDVVLRSSLDATIEWISPSIVELAGWEPSDVLHRSFLEFVDPADHPTLLARIDSAFTGESVSFDGRVRTKNGRWRWVQARARPITDAEGHISGAVVNLRDIHDEHLAREALRDSEERFRLAMESAPIGMAVVDLDRRFVEVNPSLCQMLGKTKERLEGSRVPDLMHPDDDLLDLDTRADVLGGGLVSAPTTMRLITESGSEIWVNHSIGLLRDESGLPLSYVSAFVDITQSKLSREQLQYEATHDALTRLANRRKLFLDADSALEATERTGTQVGVLYVDVDKLKSINDHYGHSIGDQVLAEVARRLSGSCRVDDLVSRIGGDEFVILLPGLHSAESADLVAAKIRKAFERPILLGELLVEVRVSIGVAMSIDGETSDETLRRADEAMYRSKELGRAQRMANDPEI